MDPLFRRAFKWALGVHAFFVLAAAFLAILSAWKRTPEPVVFELVAAAAPAPSTRDPDPASREEAIPRFEVRPVQPLKSLPDVPEEPLPTPPGREPAIPAPQPKPRPSISYEEWSRNRNLPDRRQTVQRPASSARPAPEIQTEIRNRLENSVSEMRIEGLRMGSVRDMDALVRYQVLLSKAIERVFTPTGQGLVATATFFVDPGGRIHSPRIAESSGVAGFDQAVLRALNTARSPGPPPETRTFEFSLTFRSP